MVGTVDHTDAAVSSVEVRALVYGGAVGFELPERWGAQRLWARWVLAVYLIGFVEGAGSHIADLVRGGIHCRAGGACAAGRGLAGECCDGGRSARTGGATGTG